MCEITSDNVVLLSQCSTIKQFLTVFRLWQHFRAMYKCSFMYLFVDRSVSDWTQNIYEADWKGSWLLRPLVVASVRGESELYCKLCEMCVNQTHQLFEGNGQCFGVYTGYLFCAAVTVYCAISNLFKQIASELKEISFTSRTFLHTNIDTSCRCFWSRRHFGQCVSPLSLRFTENWKRKPERFRYQNLLHSCAYFCL